MGFFSSIAAGIKNTVKRTADAVGNIGSAITKQTKKIQEPIEKIISRQDSSRRTTTKSTPRPQVDLKLIQNQTPVPSANLQSQLPQPNIQQPSADTTQPITTKETISQVPRQTQTLQPRESLTPQQQLSFSDLTQQNKASFGAFSSTATALNYAATAFSQPFKTIGAAIDPNKSMADVVNNSINRPLGEQITDTLTATAGYASVVLGVNALIGGLTARGTTYAAGNVVKGDAAKAALGQTAKAVIPKAGKVAVNTATTKAKISLLSGIASKAKNPTFVLGAIGTYGYSLVYERNPHGDAVQALQISMSEAKKNGDIEGYRKLKEYFDDLTNPDMLDEIARYTPILNVVKSEIEKIRGAKLGVDVQSDQFERDMMKNASNDALLNKINAGYATDVEIEQYAKDNPFSAVAEIVKDAKVRDANAKANEGIYGRLDPDTGEYIPSALETAKRQWNEEYYARQRYMDGGTGLSGGFGGKTEPFQLPSSLTFGLLRTAGGAELTQINPQNEANRITDVNEISTFIFGIPYDQLTDVQKQLIDLMKGG